MQAHLYTTLISFVSCSGPIELNWREDIFLCFSMSVWADILDSLQKNEHTDDCARPSIIRPAPPVCVDGGSVWFHMLWSSVWLVVSLFKTAIFLQFITRFPGK